MIGQSGGRVSEELIASLARQSDALMAEGHDREHLSRMAATWLSNEGIRPSVALVRRITNRGSNDAIARDLQKVRNELAATLKRRELKSDVPESVVGAAEAMIDGFWSGALEQARRSFDDERQQFTKERDTAYEAERIAKSLLEASQQEVSRLQSELATKDQIITEAVSRASAMESTVEELKKQLDGLHLDLDRERNEREKERERAASDLKGVHDANEKALAVVEGNRKYALLQLDSARANERALADRVKSLETERHLLDQQNRLALNALRDQLSTVSRDNGVLTGTLAATEAHLVKAQERVTALESKLSTQNEARLNQADTAARDARDRLREVLQSAGRGDATIFEFCEEHECQLFVEISDDNTPVYTLRNTADESTIAIDGTTFLAVLHYCQNRLGP